jgi:ABC-type amino acid transport system permease subunit
MSLTATFRAQPEDRPLGRIAPGGTYVSEVYRAGLSSIHPSQSAAARSLGLSGSQTLRTFLVPQAIRRVIPPLLNDFIGLQKDTAVLFTIGIPEGLENGKLWEASSSTSRRSWWWRRSSSRSRFRRPAWSTT